MKKFGAVTLLLLAPMVFLWAADPDHEGPQKAIAVLHSASGSHVHGHLTFTVKGDAVEIKGEITGLTPGEHAFHIHEFGDCSAPDAMSAGGHFNPDHHMHGKQDSDNRHVGDLGNIKADDSGKAVIDITDKVIKLHGAHSIVGRAVIVHEKVDDYSQPVGNAGKRIACGVVGIANNKPPEKK